MTASGDPRIILPLADPTADPASVGGKAESLGRLARAGFEVPGGFVVTTAAYRAFLAETGLDTEIAEALSTPEAAERIARAFAERTIPEPIANLVRKTYDELGPGEPEVAVRSSGTAEDLAEASFAGQHDTFLNVAGGDSVVAAVKRCWGSLWSARAIEYRSRHAIPPEDVAIGVIVQKMVPAEAAGVLFTADPVTGSADRVMVNAVSGLGETLVAGESAADSLVLGRESGELLERRGEPVLEVDRASELVSVGLAVEELYGRPMDIEWAVDRGRIHLLQARPITVTRIGPIWNDSLDGDYLWTSGNVSEAMPSVMTPCTWSLCRLAMSDVAPLYELDGHCLYGNIAGRWYINLSMLVGVPAALGLEGLVRLAAEQTVGGIPEGVEVPRLPMSRFRMLRKQVPLSMRYLPKLLRYLRDLSELLAETPARCDRMRARIAAIDDPRELAALWRDEIAPLLRDTCLMLAAGIRSGGPFNLITARKKLENLVGEGDAGILLGGMHTDGDGLASLGPVVGLAQVAKGELDRDEYARRWGHRCPDEMEVSAPRPAEDPQWLDRQLAGMVDAPDPEQLLARQEDAREAVWARLAESHPRKARRVRRKVTRAVQSFSGREAARSELIRAYWVMRTYLLRAGELTGHGDDLFFLEIDEILAVLDGDSAESLARVPERRAAYRRYSELPVLPKLIRGRFDPFRWAADPDRRHDMVDEHAEPPPAPDAISGFAGASGVVTGTARVLGGVDEGEALRPGEILVTKLTNVGWTPLFPRAAAVVTYIGAPLSHAAIVARELGIPAVVGCGNATDRIRTGDRIQVDGIRGTVTPLPGPDQ